jgi:hypothetical protein
MKTAFFVVLASSLILSAATANTNIPGSIAARDETMLVTVHAQGAQVYECKRDASGALAWAFREPIATLTLDGKTIGRHYAGPNWEWNDGSIVVAKVSGNAPGATERDIPLLRLDVTARSGSGVLSGVTTIQRLNTSGGKASGSCPRAGDLLSVPYAADYAFYRKAGAASAPSN